MKFELNQIIEILDNKPVILSTNIRLLTPCTDFYSLARDYIESQTDYEFVQRHQYSGYRIKSNKRLRYKIVLIPQQEKLIICSDLESDTPSKLFPYLWETVISNLDELHSFFQNWGVK
ncbi:MAG: hypothetical protein V7L11_20895 [Nostoc sp.]|uniref:hypothetical protein n=1 Tax=Nostoc sp. TaxID=1180 RepID=UPI002FF47211